MSNYTQLSYEERVLIADLWGKRKSYNFISKYIKRSWETVQLEIERNGYQPKSGKIIYQAKRAQKKYLKRREKSKIEYRIIENDFEIYEKVFDEITEKQLSPEQIIERYSKEVKNISHQTIYNWIHRLNVREKKKISKHLRRKGKKYRKASKLKVHGDKIAPKTMIDERPKEINQRERLGDFEGDTVLLTSLERFYTLVDRKSRYLILKHIPNGKAETIYQETLKIHQKFKKNILSITFDNGVEFSYHDLISTDTKIPIYFAQPYHSWGTGNKWKHQWLNQTILS